MHRIPSSLDRGKERRSRWPCVAWHRAAMGQQRVHKRVHKVGSQKVVSHAPQRSGFSKSVGSVAGEPARCLDPDRRCNLLLHPLRMMFKMKIVKTQMALVLHDVVEDCGLTPSLLRYEGFPTEVVEAVDTLTKRIIDGAEEPY